MSFFLDTSRFSSVDSRSVDGAEKKLSGDEILNDVSDVADVSDGVRNAFRKYDVVIFNSTEGYDAAANDAGHDHVTEVDDADTDTDGEVEEVTEVSIKGTVLPYAGVKDGEIVTVNDDVSLEEWTITNQCGPKAIKINDLIGEMGKKVEFKKTLDDGKRFNSVVDMMTYVLKDFLAKNNCEFGEKFSYDLKEYGVGGRDDGWYGRSQLVHFLDREQFLDSLVEMLKLNLNDAFYSSGNGRLWDVSIEGNILTLEHLEPTDRDFSIVDGGNKAIDSEAVRMLHSVNILDEASKRGVSFEIVGIRDL